MLRRFNKVFLVLVAFLFCLILASCFKQERFTFTEGKYEYSGESFNFYNDIDIKYISLDFSKENIENKDTNLLTNRKNNESYYVDFFIENEKEEGVYCTFESQKKVGDQIDRYYIKLDVSNLIKCENSFVIMVLEISNSNYYSEDKCDFEADQIFISLKKFTINDVAIKEYFFPSRLKLKYVEEPTIKKLIASSFDLRSKKILIEAFIGNIDSVDNVSEEWIRFIQKQAQLELDDIIDINKLKKDPTYDFMEFALKNEVIDFEGTKLDNIMPPISIFGGKARKKELLAERLQEYFDKYRGLVYVLKGVNYC